MKATKVVPTFLAACPTIGPAWQIHLASWGDEADRGLFNDAAVVARHVVDNFERGDLSEFPAAFGVLERCLAEGDDRVRSLALLGVIESVQNVASHRVFGPSVFRPWLGPLSRAAWDELNRWWEEVADAKAAGLLEPHSGPPPSA